jgi:hypothetical protein
MDASAQHAEIEFEAEYQLETAVTCTQCRQRVETLQVIRLLRKKVNFTSSLPRRGYVVVCPRCQSAFPAVLGGLVVG